MGYKQPNNPMKMMKSALKMHKDEKKSGMHRDSAMYMGHSPMEMGYDSPAKRESAELKDMPIVDIEKGDAKGSPAKGVGGMTNHRNFEPEGTWEKHKAAKHSGSPAKMKKDSPMEKELVGKQKNLPEALKAKIEAAPESPAKMGHKKGSPAKASEMSKEEAKRILRGDSKEIDKRKKAEAEAAKKKAKEMQRQVSRLSPVKKYDRVVLGGNKGDKSKTKPGKKDYKK